MTFAIHPSEAAWLAVGILLGILALLMRYSLVRGAPWVPTSGRRIRRLLDAAGLKPGETFLDAGCGEGRACRIAAREYGARAIGIEINPLLARIGRVWGGRYRNGGSVEVRRSDLFDAPLGEADVLFLFLLQETNERIQEKLRGELKPGTRIISHCFTLPEFRETAIPGGEPTEHLYVVQPVASSQ